MTKRKHSRWQHLTSWFLGGFAFLGLLALPVWSEVSQPQTIPLLAQSQPQSLVKSQPESQPESQPKSQPELGVHPLPASLAGWQDSTQAGDYFDQIEPLNVGSLIWSEFPIQVYVEPPPPATVTSADWMQLTQAALQAWQPYLPLVITPDAMRANIHMRAIAPPLKILPSAVASPGSRPQLVLERARSAETRYRLYQKTYSSGKVQLIHRCEIDVNPRQSLDYLRTAVIHELGHALGIWGHSPNPQDTMYFAQVRQPQGVSARDVNTLKRIYQQPTQLGWFFP